MRLFAFRATVVVLFMILGLFASRSGRIALRMVGFEIQKKQSLDVATARQELNWQYRDWVREI